MGTVPMEVFRFFLEYPFLVFLESSGVLPFLG